MNMCTYVVMPIHASCSCGNPSMTLTDGTLAVARRRRGWVGSWEPQRKPAAVARGRGRDRPRRERGARERGVGTRTSSDWVRVSFMTYLFDIVVSLSNHAHFIQFMVRYTRSERRSIDGSSKSSRHRATHGDEARPGPGHRTPGDSHNRQCPHRPRVEFAHVAASSMRVSISRSVRAP